MKEESTIKALKAKAKKGHVAALYQLYEYYLNGTYVEKDAAQANTYLSQALAIFGQQKLQISQLKINHFRAIKSLDLRHFDDHLTVIIGNNGAGKTSVLDALAMNLSWLHNRIVKNGGSGDSIDLSDITLGSEADYASIITRFNLNKTLSPEIELVKVPPLSQVNKKSAVIDMTRTGLLYKHANAVDPAFNLPILAYYTVDRSLDVRGKDITDVNDTTPITEHHKFDGYNSSLNGKADFKAFFRWFKRIDDIDKHRTVVTPSGISSEWLNRLKKLAATDAEAQKFFLQISSTFDNDPVKEPVNEQTAASVDVSRIKTILNRVISQFMDGYSNLAIQVEPFLGLTIEKNNQKLNVLQLSQGEKSMLALVLDITRRLILLNPSLEDPLDGAGVVLIDEFDLHLHPAWQRKIIRELPKIFNQCQFIVTTHSPQILGEVKHDQIIMLHQNDHNEIESSRPKQSWGLTSNDILNELMVTSDPSQQLVRTPLVEQQLIDIYSLIANEDFTQATTKIASLEKELNGEIPELVSAKLDIDLSGWDD